MKELLVFAVPFLIQNVLAEFTFPCKEGSTFHHEGSCSVFYSCYEADKPILVYCPGSDEYNHEKGECSPPEEANCVLPDTSVWESEKRPSTEEREEDVRSHEEENRYEWPKEESKEESTDSGEVKGKEKIENPSLGHPFSWSRVVQTEVMRDESSEDHSETKEESKEKDEDFQDRERSDDEEHSIWKRQIPKRFRRSEKVSSEEKSGIKFLPESTVLLGDISSDAQQSKAKEEIPKKRHVKRSAKKDDDEPIAKEGKSKDEESKNEEEKNENESNEEKVLKKETENEQRSKESKIEEKNVEEPKEETVSDEETENSQQSKESVDESVQTGEAAKGCGLILVSDPLDFQLSTSDHFHKDTIQEKYEHLASLLPYVVDIVLTATNSSLKENEEKEVALEEEKKVNDDSQDSSVNEKESVAEHDEKEKKDSKEKSIVTVEEVEKVEEKAEDKSSQESSVAEVEEEKKIEEKKEENEKADDS